MYIRLRDVYEVNTRATWNIINNKKIDIDIKK